MKKYYAVSVDLFNLVDVVVFDNKEKCSEWCKQCTDFEICRCEISREKAMFLDTSIG